MDFSHFWIAINTITITTTIIIKQTPISHRMIRIHRHLLTGFWKWNLSWLCPPTRPHNINIASLQNVLWLVMDLLLLVVLLFPQVMVAAVIRTIKRREEAVSREDPWNIQTRKAKRFCVWISFDVFMLYVYSPFLLMLELLLYLVLYQKNFEVLWNNKMMLVLVCVLFLFVALALFVWGC